MCDKTSDFELSLWLTKRNLNPYFLISFIFLYQTSQRFCAVIKYILLVIEFILNWNHVHWTYDNMLKIFLNSLMLCIHNILSKLNNYRTKYFIKIFRTSRYFYEAKIYAIIHWNWINFLIQQKCFTTNFFHKETKHSYLLGKVFANKWCFNSIHFWVFFLCFAQIYRKEIALNRNCFHWIESL